MRKPKYIGLTFKSKSCGCRFELTDFYKIYIDGNGEIRTNLYGANIDICVDCVDRYPSWYSGQARSKPFKARRQFNANMIQDFYENNSSRFMVDPLSYAKSRKASR